MHSNQFPVHQIWEIRLRIKFGVPWLGRPTRRPYRRWTLEWLGGVHASPVLGRRLRAANRLRRGIQPIGFERRTLLRQGDRIPTYVWPQRQRTSPATSYFRWVQQQGNHWGIWRLRSSLEGGSTRSQVHADGWRHVGSLPIMVEDTWLCSGDALIGVWGLQTEVREN